MLQSDGSAVTQVDAGMADGQDLTEGLFKAIGPQDLNPRVGAFIVRPRQVDDAPDGRQPDLVIGAVLLSHMRPGKASRFTMKNRIFSKSGWLLMTAPLASVPPVATLTTTYRL